MKTFPQGSLLFPKGLIEFKTEGNRLVKLAAGQSVWVANSTLDQSKTGIVRLARSGKNAGYAWPFSAEDVETYFKPVEA